MVSQLNNIFSRCVNPLESAVVSVTQIHSGRAWNIIPDACVIRGTVRTFTPTLRDSVQQHITHIANQCITQATISY